MKKQLSFLTRVHKYLGRIAPTLCSYWYNLLISYLKLQYLFYTNTGQTFLHLPKPFPVMDNDIHKYSDISII